MSSQAQLDANRRNALKSTGPRTETGKAKSSLNALKTGINSKREIIPGEDPRDLQTLTDEYLERWNPTTPEQRFLIDALVFIDWTVRRLRHAEAEFWTFQIEDAWQPARKTPLGRAYAANSKKLDNLGRRLESAIRTHRKTLESLIKLKAAQAEPEPPAPAPEPLPRTVPEPPPHQSDPVTIGFVLPNSKPAESTPLTSQHSALPEGATQPSALDILVS